jgi:UPF0716 protein FxsA
MPALLVLAFVVVPLIELVVILQVGQVIGAGWTIALLVIDSLVGAWLLKRESVRAWHDFRSALAAGRWPGDEVTQGGLVIVGGALLLTPGFVTDVVGLLALLPPSRAVASRLIRRRLGPGVVLGGAGAAASGGRRRSGDRSGSEPRSRRAGSGDPDVLDVEVLGVEREPAGEADADRSAAPPEDGDPPPLDPPPPRDPGRDERP